MTFYLAGPYSAREHLRGCATAIARISGWTCNARWLDGSHDGMLAYRAAREDVEDVRSADALVMVANRQSTRGGMWVEMGIAAERGIPIVIVCDEHTKLNVFAWLQVVVWAATVDEAGDELRYIGDARRGSS